MYSQRGVMIREAFTVTIRDAITQRQISVCLSDYLAATNVVLRCSSIETIPRLQMRAIGKFECRDVLPPLDFDARNPQKSFPAASND